MSMQKSTPEVSRDDRPEVTLSVGLGRLHFMQAAEVIAKHGIDLKVIQGWVPGRFWTEARMDAVGRLVGSKKLSVGMKRRRLPFLRPERNIGLASPEVLIQLMFVAHRKFGLKRGTAALVGWTQFGRASRRHFSGDILHLRSGGGGGGAIAAARARGMKIVADHSIAHPAFLEDTLHDEFGETGAEAWLSPDDPFWNRVLEDCRQADMVLVNSDFVKTTFVAQGFDPERIAVIYLGVREDFRGLKRDYACKRAELQLLFTGQFGTRKGARYLIGALERLADRGVPFRLTALGEAREGRELLKASNIRDRVDLPGFVPQDELKTYLETADIYVFPSLAEGCASSAMEALAAGLPVVATAETGLPVRDGEEAMLVPAKDPDALCDALFTLASDEAGRRRLGENAARMISENYGWDDYGRNVAELYHRLRNEGC